MKINKAKKKFYFITDNLNKNIFPITLLYTHTMRIREYKWTENYQFEFDENANSTFKYTIRLVGRLWNRIENQRCDQRHVLKFHQMFRIFTMSNQNNTKPMSYGILFVAHTHRWVSIGFCTYKRTILTRTNRDVSNSLSLQRPLNPALLLKQTLQHKMAKYFILL